MRPTPVSAESPFSADEMFFSRTDLHGVIIDGNSVFVRVSEYPKDKMLGQPHNIIRHPDMPKTAFKLLWDTLGSGSPICAYVKNMSATGKYYWVLAIVFPIQNGYLSIRLKPVSPIREIVEGLYKQTLAEERKSGMEGGLKLVVQALGSLGFTDYFHFMTKALVSELTGHIQAVDRLEKAPSQTQITRHPAIQDELRKSQQAIQAYRLALDKSQAVNALSESFITITQGIAEACKSLNVLAFNIGVAARRQGELGKTLTVVADTFQNMMTDVRAQVQQFEQAMIKGKKQFLTVEFNTAAAYLQAEVCVDFLKEILKEEELSPEHLENVEILKKLVQQYSQITMQSLNDLTASMRNLLRDIGELQSLVNGMGMVRHTGSIESARHTDLQKEFATHIDDMQSFVHAVQPKLEEIRLATSTILEDTGLMLRQLQNA